MAGVGDEGPLALEGRLQPREHRVQGLAEPADLVAGGGDGEPRPGVRGLDAGGAPAHPLDRPQRGGRDAVARQRGEQEGRRPADREQLGEAAQRVAAVVEVRADDDDQVAILGVHRRGEQPRRLLLGRQLVALDRDGGAQRAPALGRAQQRCALVGGGRIDDTVAGVEDLGEVLPPLGERQPARRGEPTVGLRDQGADVARARAQALVDRRVELGLEPQVDEQPGGREHQRHHAGERQRQAEAQRQAAER